MARPPRTRAPEATDMIAKADVNHEALQSAGDAAATIGQQLAIVEKDFGIDLPYSRDLFIAQGRQLIGEIGLKSLQLGLICIQLKAHEARGDFLIALGAIGITPRFAQKCMQVARKFGGSEHRKQLANYLGMSKVLALIDEEEGDLDALANGGELAGFTADEFAKMTKADVIAALQAERDERADEKAADEEIIRKKDERINKLSRRTTRNTAREKIDDALLNFHRLALDIKTNCRDVLQQVTEIRAAYEEANLDIDPEIEADIETNLRQILQWVEPISTEVEGQ